MWEDEDRGWEEEEKEEICGSVTSRTTDMLLS